MVFTAVWAVGLLGGCAGYGPAGLAPGDSEADVVRAMGAPTGRYALADGSQRLEFARGPSGRHTYMVDVDAQQRVLRIEQVLDAPYFATVKPGQTGDDVLRVLGRPSQRQGILRQAQVWSWRYANYDCLWYQAQLDAQGIVTSAGYAIEPSCVAGARPKLRGSSPM
jgi:hypothetical protein